MKVLVTGSTGQLGKTLIAYKPENINLIKVSSEDFNLLDSESCKDFILLHKPDWIINAAAYTAVDKAESESEIVFEVNTTAPEKIAKTLSTYGGKMLYVSTDFVFDGKNIEARAFGYIPIIIQQYNSLIIFIFCFKDSLSEVSPMIILYAWINAIFRDSV